MLLAIDVGNTQTAIGLFESDELAGHWRISTRADDTADQLFVVIADLLRLAEARPADVNHAIVASVVPALTNAYETMTRERFGVSPMVVGPGLETGVPILYDNPAEVGADRIVDAVAALARYGHGPVIVVDFGTATTFDAISADGAYIGGVIAPGVEVSADALFHAAAKLSRVELEPPPTVIGRNTRQSIQSGLLYGEAGMVDAIVSRMRAEIGGDPPVLATGGLAELMAPLCKTITDQDPLLTLTGLLLLWRLNHDCPATVRAGA
jgi:type III pantothenate kinase